MIKDMGLMLCNHASIGMWSVFKEPEVYLLSRHAQQLSPAGARS